MKRATRSLIATGAVASVIMLTACAGPADDGGGSNTGDKSPYKIGFNDDLSGPISFAGLTSLAGFQTYIDYVNAEEGGVNGHPIELTALDSRADGATSVANFKQLVDEGALIVAGNASTAAWTPTGPLAEQLGVVQLGLGSVDSFFDPVQPYIFKTQLTQALQVELMGQAVKADIFPDDNEGLKIAVIGLDTATGPLFVAGAEKVADENDWEIVESELVAATAPDCTSQAALIANSKPDIIFASLTPGPDVICFKQLQTNGYDGIVLQNAASPGEATVRALKSDKWVIMRMTNWWEDTETPGTKAMLQQAIDYGHIGQLGAYSSDGYVQAMVVVAALKACGDDCTGETVQKAMSEIKDLDTNGLSGPAFGFVDDQPFGHVSPYGRFFVWDDEAQHSVPFTDWLCIPGRCDAE